MIKVNPLRDVANTYVEIVELEGVGDGDIADGYAEYSWADFIEMMARPRIRKTKNGEAWMPVVFKDQAEWVLSKPRKGQKGEPTYRNAQNVEKITLLVLDLDTPDAIPRAMELFNPFEYFLHSTYSDSADQRKARIVVLLEEPISVEDWPRVFRAVVTPIDADRSCSDVSRIYFKFSSPPKTDVEPLLVYNEGRPLSHQDILEIEALYKVDEPENTAGPRPVHFSGQADSGRYRLRESRVKIDYASMLERHKDAIEENLPIGAKGLRNNFVRDVCMSEMGRLKASINLDHLVQFLFRVVLERSTLPLSVGNTVSDNEIPRLIVGAADFILRNNGPSEPGIRALAQIRPWLEEEAEAAVYRALEAEELALTLGRGHPDYESCWVFSRAPGQVAATNEGGAGGSYRDFLMRYDARLSHFVKHEKSIVPFAQHVFRNESLDKENFSLLLTTQFLFRVALGYLEKIKGFDAKTSVEKTAERLPSTLLKNAESFCPAGASLEDFSKELEMACKITCLTLNGELPWQFPDEVRKEKKKTRTKNLDEPVAVGF